MTNLIKNAACLLLMTAFGACNTIDNNERWLSEAQDQVAEGERNTILVEEYTGQKCINCPGAATELHKIAKEYPANVIIVALHAPGTGQTQAELASQDADVYATSFKLPKSVPGIMINRRSGEDGLYSQKKALWGTLIRKAVNRKAQYRIDLKATPSGDKHIDIRAAVSSLRDEAASRPSLGLQLWVVEDIRAEQVLVTGNKQADYFHHNVLRGALNGVTGADCKAGETYALRADVPASVVRVANTKVVACLFDRDSKEIYEAAIVPLGEGIQPDADEDAKDKEKTGEAGEGLSFRYDTDKVVASGGEIKATRVERSGNAGKEVEVVTPIINIVPGKAQAMRKYTVEISKEDHAGAEYGGLSQICLAQCEVSENTEAYTKEDFELTNESILQIHYKIAEKYQDQQKDYRVRVSFKQGGKQVGHLRIVFSYDPKQKGEPNPNPQDPGNNPQPEVPIPTPNPEPSTKSNAVAMDFTGQRCPHCPAIIYDLRELETQYKPNLIVVAIHPKNRLNYDSSFTCPESSFYAQTLGIKGYPTVLVNCKPRVYLSHDVREAVNRSPVLASTLQAKAEGTNVTLSFTSKTTQAATETFRNRKLNLLFWVVENNVKGFQTYTEDPQNFIHNHILRGALNGFWGETYTPGSEVRMSKPLPSTVKEVKNCELIGIVLDADTKEFLDAVKVKL